MDRFDILMGQLLAETAAVSQEPRIAIIRARMEAEYQDEALLRDTIYRAKWEAKYGPK